ncbi:Histone H1 [Spatholobus suberectus]|nr:Histone H1 [Spatholobus suberectus]
MEPSSISPPPAPPATAVPFPAEPNDHPPAPAIPEPPSNHPPYAKMIYTAIEALKEKNGSSKRAIAKYIEQEYKDQLPPNHSALLTHHLTRLKNNGMLQMVKKSYTLPRSAPLPGLAPPASAAQTPRPRGRPRKAQTPAHNLPQDAAHAQAQQNAEPVWAALGLADEPAQAAATDGGKKRPGRPKKNTAPGAGPAPRGRPPGSVSQKRPGRPPKAKPAETPLSAGPKRRPGRPPKNQTQVTPIPFAPAAPGEPAAVPDAAGAGAGPGALLGPRSRGRPKKYADEVVAAGRGRGRGRGRAVVAVVVGEDGGEGAGDSCLRSPENPGQGPWAAQRRGQLLLVLLKMLLMKISGGNLNTFNQK